MFPLHQTLLAYAAALVVVLARVGGAEAGWITVKNDSTKALIVQEVVTVNGKQIRGKPIKLLAGESFREFQNTPDVKSYEVLSTGTPAVTLWSGKLNCRADTQRFSITTVKGRFVLVQLPEPKPH
jgi:hypothetical protein